MLTKNRVAQLLVMLIVLVTLFIWRTVTTKPEQVKNVELTAVAPLSELPACDYVKPCKFASDHGTFWLSVANLPVKAEQWINFSLKGGEKDWRVVDAKIVGKEMFMGRIPVTFTQTDKNIFSAKTLVGACTTPKMIWQLQINIEVNSANELLLFDFMVEK
ncbi:hypothetical protein [Psychromonas sp.]|uniref:hypothetical protein n=1 Tax=Psychromonas sp. TaxID=1884585 RepID=UPI0035636B43